MGNTDFFKSWGEGEREKAVKLVDDFMGLAGSRCPSHVGIGELSAENCFEKYDKCEDCWRLEVILNRNQRPGSRGIFGKFTGRG